ncbi:hypothetical protein YY29_003623 [Salmonella enterica subsp. enterica]|nr:hypothetical protein [Salmonella enterica subsp. enterica]
MDRDELEEDRANITVGYPQTNRKIDTGKTLTRWPVFVDHFIERLEEKRRRVGNVIHKGILRDAAAMVMKGQ